MAQPNDSDDTHLPPPLTEAWELTHQAEIRRHKADRETGRPAAWQTWTTRFVWTRDRDVPPEQELWRSATTLSPAPRPQPGSIPPEGSFWPPEGFTLIETWSREPDRLAWTHQTMRAVLTYCEGDLSILTCLDAETWSAVRREHAAFYQEH